MSTATAAQPSVASSTARASAHLAQLTGRSWPIAPASGPEADPCEATSATIHASRTPSTPATRIGAR